MLTEWVFFDEHKYTPRTLQNIFEHSVPLADASTLRPDRIRRLLGRLVERFPGHVGLLLLGGISYCFASRRRFVTVLYALVTIPTGVQDDVGHFFKLMEVFLIM